MSETLLSLTQTVLSSMDSDEVNSISDTVEANQVALVIKTVYFDIITRANLPEHYTLRSMVASGTSAKPTLMTLPSDVAEVYWLKYNKATLTDTDDNFQPVELMTPADFLDRMHSLDTTETNVSTFSHTLNSDAMTFVYRDDKAPEVYMCLDDNTLIFDSYDAEVDTTLQTSKTLAYCKKTIPFTMSDTFVPDLDDAQTSLLLNESKALAWAELKQTSHGKAERTASRGWTRLQQTKFRTSQPSFFNSFPNFGRK